MELPKPKLGDVSAITINSPDLDSSLSFYQQLGFTEVMRDSFLSIQISDGALLITLKKDREPYIALTYYPENIVPIVADLETQGISFVSKANANDSVKQFVLQSPDGMNVSLMEIPDGIHQPPGPNMLTMQPQDYTNTEKYVNKTCGIFGEFAHPVKNLDASISFWSKLGFVALSKFDSPYPWAILSDGLTVIGAHQTTDFSNPAITFFAADMKEKIKALKEKGIANEATEGQSNIVLTTPEKQFINLFNLGM